MQNFDDIPNSVNRNYFKYTQLWYILDKIDRCFHITRNDPNFSECVQSWYGSYIMKMK